MVLALGAVAQIVLLFVAHVPRKRQLVGDEILYQTEAMRLVRGEPFTPSFVHPALYSHVLALIHRFLSPERIAVELVQSAVLLGTGVLLWALLARAGLGVAARATALALFLLDPQVAAFAQYLWPEVFHLGFLLLALWLLLAAPQPAKWAAFAAGMAYGLALLTKSLILPFVPVLVGAAWWSAAARSPWLRARRAAAFAGGIVMVVAPVVAANGVYHGYWGLANSGPFNAWSGLDDPPNRHDYDSVVWPRMTAFLGSSTDPAERNRRAWAAVREEIARRGPLEVIGGQLAKQYGRLLDKESFFTDQLPGGRWRRNAAPQPRDGWLRAWAYGVYAIVLGLAGLGIGLADWTRGRALALPALFLAYNFGLFLLLHVKTRYRFAFLPCLVFFAAVAVDRWRTEPGALSSARGRTGLLMGLALGGALLLLAFGHEWPEP